MSRYTPLFETFGWAVLHSLWQGALVLALVLLVRKIAGPTRPSVSYAAGVAGLGVAFVAFLGTLFVLVGNGAVAAPPAAGGGGEILQAAAGVAVLDAPTASRSPALLPALMPWLGILWAVGFLVLSFQCMYAWARTRCFATMGLSEPGPEWTERFTRLVRDSGTLTDIRLQVSALVDSPVTLGTLKPLVLVPAGFLSGFPPEQVEAILLHEIAHIRRHDFLVGLFQTAVRTTLYFNPAVRVISRWVDEDREQACDDFAVRRTGRPLDLAKGLASLRLSLAPEPMMAASDTKSGPLMARLERLAGRATQARGLDRVTAFALSGLFVGATVWGSTSYAHPPESKEVRRILVFGDKVPPMPPMPEMPAMPPMPPIPAVPELPAMGFNPFSADSTADFEAKMEAWGAQMEVWGESFGDEWGEEWAEQVEEAFGEEFESRMETWGEQMEAWGESLEHKGEYLESLEDMSDSELAELGLTRNDVDIAAESFGLSVAEGVVGEILPGFLSGEARAEIARERADLDSEALARVERALKEKGLIDGRLAGGYAYGFGSTPEEAERARSNAERAMANAERARDNAERARHNAERARDNAERARDNAKRAKDNARKSAKRSVEMHKLRDGLASRLAKDGLIGGAEGDFVFKTSETWTKVDGKKLTSAQHTAYRDYLASRFDICEEADLGLERDGGRVMMELHDGDDTTRVTITD